MYFKTLYHVLTNLLLYITDQIKASKTKFNVDSQSLKDAFDILLLKIKDDVSSLTFGKELLAAAHFDEFLSKIQSLLTSVDFLMNIPHYTESVEPGTIYVFNVEVLFEDNKLVVKEMVIISFSKSLSRVHVGKKISFDGVYQPGKESVFLLFLESFLNEIT